MKINFVLFVVFLIFSSNTFAQFKNGYVVRLNGDTVFCKIEYRNFKSISTEVKVMVGAEELVYKPEQITGFGLSEGIHFVSKQVSFYTNPIDYTIAPAEFSDAKQEGTFFLKILDKGAVVLYRLDMPARHYFFVEEKYGSPTELVYRVKYMLNNPGEDGTFKTQLNTLLDKYQLLSANPRRTANITYSNDHIRSVIRLINSKAGGEQFSIKKSKSVWVIATAGVSQVTYTNDVRSAFLNPPNLYSFEPYTSPSFGFVIGLKSEGKSFRIRPEVSLSYRSAQLNGIYTDTTAFDALSYDRVTEQYIMKRKDVLLGLSPVLYITGTRQIEFFIKPGLGFLLDVNGSSLESAVKSERVQFADGRSRLVSSSGLTMGTKNMKVQMYAAAGVQWKRHRIEFTYIPAADLLKEPVDVQLRTAGVMVHYGFRFLN